MKPNVLLIVLPYVEETHTFLGFPYGLLSVATYNKDQANIKIVDLNIEDWEKTLSNINNFPPDIIGFTMMYDNSYQYLEKLLNVVKEVDPTILTILGGAAASYSYEEILNEQPNLDAICYGEGEIPFRDLLVSGKERWFGNCAWITRGKIEYGRTPEISYVKDLDEVINIDYSFIDPSVYDTYQAFSPFVDHNKKQKQFFLMTSRGCPFECTFCSNSTIHGKKMRFASVDKMINHVEYLIGHYGMNVLTMYDDQLLINMPRAKEFFRRLAEYKLRIECPNGLSAAFIDKEMAMLLKAAGMDTIYLAIESGSEYVLKHLMNKPLKLSQVKSAVKSLQENDIFVLGFFVIGMPGETTEHREETRQFIKESGLDWASLQMATPFRGSKLYDMCIKENWITKNTLKEVYAKSGGLFMETFIDIPGRDSKEVNREVYEMNLDVNFHNNRRMKIGDYKTAARCFEEVIARYPDHDLAKHYLEVCKEKI